MTARYLWTLMLVAGCGRLDFNDQAPLPPDDTGTNDRVPPEVCWVTTWTQVAFAQTDIDVSVATTPSGVTVVWTPTSGGDLSGINLDRTWRLTANPGVIQPGSWLRSSVTWIADQLVTAEAETGGSVKIFTSQPDLSGGAEIGCPLASSVSKPPLVHAGSDTLLLTGWACGLILTP